MKLSICLALFLGLFAVQTVNAQTLDFGSAVDQWAVACRGDVEANCSKIRPGTAEFRSCLQNNASAACQQASAEFESNMNARFAAQAEAPKACKQDVQRLCAGFNAGGARLLRCLMKPEKFRAATKACKNTLAAAGWLDEISIRK